MNKGRARPQFCNTLHVRAIQHHDGVLILDDRMSEKPYTDENDSICWHYDHAHERTVKGINFITALYHAQGVSLPVGVTIIAKNEHYIDNKDGKEKRRSPIEKNVFFRAMIKGYSDLRHSHPRTMVKPKVVEPTRHFPHEIADGAPPDS